MSTAHAPAPHIRRATRADLDALLALEHGSFDHDRISRAQFLRHLGSGSALVLVVTQAGAVHAAAVVLFRRGARTARLYSIAVDAAARGRGYGAALLDAAERLARKRGCTGMRLEVRTDNRAAIALYERRGYRRRERLAGFYENGSDAWRYDKDLGAVTPKPS